jgi:hypothetical protein
MKLSHDTEIVRHSEPRPSHGCDLAPTRAPAANKPKALSAARGDWDIVDDLQSHILPGTHHGPS